MVGAGSLTDDVELEDDGTTRVLDGSCWVNVAPTGSFIVVDLGGGGAS